MNESFLLVRNFVFCHYTLYKFDQLRIESIVKLREETANTLPGVEPEECVCELLNLYGHAHLFISYYISMDVMISLKLKTKSEKSKIPGCPSIGMYVYNIDVCI